MFDQRLKWKVFTFGITKTIWTFKGVDCNRILEKNDNPSL